MSESQTKKCARCRQHKSVENFYRNISKKDNKDCYCKNCTLEKKRNSDKKKRAEKPEVYSEMKDHARSHQVYQLRDPRDNCVKYVGVTLMKLENRLNLHLSEPRRFNPEKYDWLYALKRQFMKPSIELLHDKLYESQALQIEKELLGYYGSQLVNLHKSNSVPKTSEGKRLS